MKIFLAGIMQGSHTDDQVLHETSQKIDLENAPSLEKLLLQLNIQKQG